MAVTKVPRRTSVYAVAAKAYLDAEVLLSVNPARHQNAVAVRALYELMGADPRKTPADIRKDGRNTRGRIARESNDPLNAIDRAQELVTALSAQNLTITPDGELTNARLDLKRKKQADYVFNLMAAGPGQELPEVFRRGNPLEFEVKTFAEGREACQRGATKQAHEWAEAIISEAIRLGIEVDKRGRTAEPLSADDSFGSSGPGR